MLSEPLQQKVDRALRLLRQIAPPQSDPIEVAYSGGKDSDVCLQLVREAGIPYRAIYKCTTIDPPGTLAHVRAMGAEVLKPKKTFFQLIDENGLPNRNYRFCCSKLKEYKVLDRAVMGIRKDESTSRDKRYQEPTECRFYGSKKEHVEAIYPILDWITEDVAEFLQDRGIRCAPHYYDADGRFHPERRLGCICCCLQYTKTRIRSFQQYPRMVRLYLKHAQAWWDNPQHDDSSMKRRYDDVYEWFVRDLFYDDTAAFEADKHGLFGRPDYKQMLEDFFGIDLTI